MGGTASRPSTEPRYYPDNSRMPAPRSTVKPDDASDPVAVLRREAHGICQELQAQLDASPVGPACIRRPRYADQRATQTVLAMVSGEYQRRGYVAYDRTEEHWVDVAGGAGEVAWYNEVFCVTPDYSKVNV